MKFSVGQYVWFKSPFSRERCVGKIILLEKAEEYWGGHFLYYRIKSGKAIITVMPSFVERLALKDERFLYELNGMHRLKGATVDAKEMIK